MSRKLTIEEIKIRLKKAHNDTVILDESTYINTITKCRFIDSDFGEWWAKPNSVIWKKCGHQARGTINTSKSNTISIDIIKEQLAKIHGDIITIDESTYINTITKCRFIDRDFGEWWAKPNNIIKLRQRHMMRGITSRIKLQTSKINNIKSALFAIHGDIITIDEKTYVNTHTKCWFIDKDFGKWFASPNSILCGGHGHPSRTNEKYTKTCLKKYGVTHPFKSDIIKLKISKTNIERYGASNPMKNINIALKSAVSRNNSCILTHWKTGQKIICVASYERKTVNYLNKNKIDFVWQSQIFVMPNGKTYRPDAYIPSLKKWIEIKGYFWDDAREKWEWFNKEYPNSELWNSKKLKELGILRG